MALRTPYEFDLDPETNPLGEKQVSVADPIESAGGAHTYYLSRRFTFAEGDYTFLIGADDAATVWIGTTQLNTRIFATPTLSVPAEVGIHIPAGQYRIDVILTNLPAGPNPCYFQMVIKQGDQIIYASAKEGWMLDDIAISDEDLPPGTDPRLSMPIWTVLPNWETGIVERLAWHTDILDSETDAEQRRSVRRNARRSFEASFLRQRHQAQRMDAFFTGVGPAPFLVPLWHEQVKMLDGISLSAAGVNFADGELRLREFRKGDLIFVNNGDPDNYDLLEVGDIEQDRFSWASPPSRTWPVGTRIYPMRVARMVQSAPKVSHITDGVSRAQVLFDMVEPYMIAASWGAQQNGEPLFAFDVDRANPIDVQYDRKNYIIDNTAGRIAVTDHGRYTAMLVNAKVRLFGRSAAFRFRQFLQAARGRARHFYAPTFMRDIEPVADVLANTTQLAIKPQGFRRSMIRPQPTRSMLAFEFRDSTPTIYAEVKNVEEVYQDRALVAEVLELENPLPAITLAELKRISFVCETRFEQDQFEIHHPTNGHAMIEVSLVLRQATNQRDIPA